MTVESLKKEARRHEQKEEWTKELDLYLQAIEAQAGEDEPTVAIRTLERGLALARHPLRMTAWECTTGSGRRMRPWETPIRPGNYTKISFPSTSTSRT